MKAGPGDVAQDCWVNSLLNFFVFLCVFYYASFLLHCLCISQYYQSISQNNIGIFMHMSL